MKTFVKLSQSLERGRLLLAYGIFLFLLDLYHNLLSIFWETLSMFITCEECGKITFIYYSIFGNAIFFLAFYRFVAKR